MSANFILIVLICSSMYLTSCQSFQQAATLDINQRIRQQQYSSRDQNQMNYDNIQSYTIKAQGIESFFLNAQVDQQIKCQFYVYWKESNIFISSEYRQGEEVRVLVYQDDQRILVDRVFYMVNGIKFNVRKGSNYEVRFITSGNINKIVSMTITKMLDAANDLLQKHEVVNKQNKITKIRWQIHAFFSMSQKNFIIENQLVEQVLRATKVYMGYQIIQIIIVLLISLFQTVFITQILNTNSIV